MSVVVTVAPLHRHPARPRFERSRRFVSARIRKLISAVWNAVTSRTVRLPAVDDGQVDR